MSAPSARRAAFLDRDGVLVDELDFLTDPERLVLLPGAARAVARLNASGLAVCCITNQSAIARGLLSEERLLAIHERLAELLAREGARLDGVFHCPHHPDVGPARYRIACQCRKPAPGLILRAARELRLELATSWLVGDAARDLEAGRRAGLTRLVLVRTGKGRAEWERMDARQRDGVRGVEDLSAAVDLVLAHEG